MPNGERQAVLVLRPRIVAHRHVQARRKLRCDRSVLGCIAQSAPGRDRRRRCKAKLTDRRRRIRNTTKRRDPVMPHAAQRAERRDGNRCAHERAITPPPAPRPGCTFSACASRGVTLKPPGSAISTLCVGAEPRHQDHPPLAAALASSSSRICGTAAVSRSQMRIAAPGVGSRLIERRNVLRGDPQRLAVLPQIGGDQHVRCRRPAGRATRPAPRRTA